MHKFQVHLSKLEGLDQTHRVASESSRAQHRAWPGQTPITDVILGKGSVVVTNSPRSPMTQYLLTHAFPDLPVQPPQASPN